MINHKFEHKHAANEQIQEADLTKNLPLEAQNVMKILGQLENFTLQLKKKLLTELNSAIEEK